MNPHLYDEQIPPVVYLSGVLLFVAGLSVVRVHNRWCRGWPILVTLTGWLAIALGLLRMFAPAAYSEGADAAGGAVLVGEAAIVASGMFLTFKAHSRAGSSQRKPRPRRAVLQSRIGCPCPAPLPVSAAPLIDRSVGQLLRLPGVR